MIDRLQEILQAVHLAALERAVDLPDERYTMIGTPVVTCASVVVGLTNKTPAPGFEAARPCDKAWQGSFTIAIARESEGFVCADATTNVAEMDRVSVQAEADAEVLTAAINSLTPGIGGPVTGEVFSWELAGEGSFFVSQLDFSVGL